MKYLSLRANFSSSIATSTSAADWLGVPADHANRIKVEPDLSTPGYPEIFVIGDTATIDGWHGKPVPGIAPPAKQQGRSHGASGAETTRRENDYLLE